jgi:hypothetical protein
MATQGRTEQERQLAHGREGGGGAKSYDGKKAWSSINYSILSAISYQVLPNSSSLYGFVIYPYHICSNFKGSNVFKETL